MVWWWNKYWSGRKEYIWQWCGGWLWHAVPMVQCTMDGKKWFIGNHAATSSHFSCFSPSPSWPTITIFFTVNIYNTSKSNLYFIKWSLYISLLSIPKHQRLKNANSVLPFEVLRERGLQSQLHSFLICNREREGGRKNIRNLSKTADLAIAAFQRFWNVQR